MKLYVVGRVASLADHPCLDALPGLLQASGFTMIDSDGLSDSDLDPALNTDGTIRDCSVLVLVVSDKTRHEARVRRAWEEALRLHKPIIQLVMGRPEVPDALRIWEAIDFTTCSAAAQQRLLRALNWIHSPEYGRLKNALADKLRTLTMDGNKYPPDAGGKSLITRVSPEEREKSANQIRRKKTPSGKRRPDGAPG